MLPRRTCIGCRRVAAVSGLVRLRRAATAVELGIGAGRGAWLCGEHPVECLDQAIGRHGLDRALRTTVNRDDVERLRARLIVGSK